MFKKVNNILQNEAKQTGKIKIKNFKNVQINKSKRRKQVKKIIIKKGQREVGKEKL